MLFLKITIILDFLLLLTAVSFAANWIHPREVVKDPMLARLQQGRKELTAEEREEIKRYGYTGLEIMTYVDDHADPGQDFDAFQRVTLADAGGDLRITEMLLRQKHYYRDNLALLTQEGIGPGDVEHKRFAIFLYPEDDTGNAALGYRYMRSEKVYRGRDAWIWSNKLRRIRRFTTLTREDQWTGSDITYEDLMDREPWEETHKIIGEDHGRGYECLVIESRNRVNPGYYLGKRVTWVEKTNFLDVHEEQFDRKGKLFKIIDKDWQQIKPWNYWVSWQWNVISLGSKHRTLYQSYDWIFDQGFGDDQFSRDALRREKVWREAKRPPRVRDVSELPPEPKIRWEFWNRIGVKPEAIK